MLTSIRDLMWSSLRAGAEGSAWSALSPGPRAAAVFMTVLGLGMAPPARAATEVSVFAVGVNRSFAPELAPLRYAELDAERFVRAMTSVGLVPAARATVVTGSGIGEFRRVLRDLATRDAASGGDGRKFIFYFSGHADDRGLHFPDGAISKAELHQTLATLRAQTKVAIVDSCFSGAIALKGIEPAAAFELPKMEYDEPSGSVFLAASSARQYAFESEHLQSSVFTHHLLAGLYGEADGNTDGLVTIDELYQYVYRNTKWQSLSYPAAASQEPEISASLRGQGAVVLSFPAQTNSSLALAPDMSGEVALAGLSGMQFFRVQKLAGAEKRLKLPAGRYRVSVHRGDRLGTGEVLLSPAAVTTIGATNLTWREAAASDGARKGDGTPAAAPVATSHEPAGQDRWALHLGAGAHQGFETEGRPGALAEVGVFAGFGAAWRLEIGGLLNFHRHDRDNPDPLAPGPADGTTWRTDSSAAYLALQPAWRAGGFWIGLLAGYGQTYHDQRLIVEDSTSAAAGAAVPGMIGGAGIGWSVGSSVLSLSVREETIDLRRLEDAPQHRARGRSALLAVKL